MNAAARLWQALCAAVLDPRRDRLTPVKPRSRRDSTPQLWLETPVRFLERQQVRCDRHSWLADFSVTGPAWTCSTCGCSVPAVSEMTVTEP